MFQIKNLTFFHDSNISERLGVDFGGNKCWAVLRHLSPSEVKTLANFETRLQINYPDLVLKFIVYVAYRCTQ